MLSETQQNVDGSGLVLYLRHLPSFIIVH